jgi:hypothetical protein
VLKMTPENHDAAFAAVSHLPHLLAFAYFSAVTNQPAGRTSCRWPGRAFATSRASPPATRDVWRDILVANREEVLKQSQRFRQALDALEHVMRRRQRRRAGGPDPRPRRRPRLADGARACLADGLRCAGPGPAATSRTMYDNPLPRPAAAAGASGTVRLPGSKSISNRVLLLAGLAAGTTAVHDLLDSDDTRVMLAALRALGCGLRKRGPCCTSPASAARLGCTRRSCSWAMPARRCGRCGGAGGAGRHPGRRFDSAGVPRMHERPIGDLVDALRPLGCTHRRPRPARLPAAARARQPAAGWPPRGRSACAATCRASS